MRDALRALGLALATLLVAPAVGHATPVASHFRVAIDSAAANADFSLTPARSRYVILQAWEAPRARRLKLANPGLKVLVYKDLSLMAARDNAGNLSTGVSTQEAASHPEWYLRNDDGEAVTSRHYSSRWLADVGDAGYQARWAANVLNVLVADGWDGVFMDDTNPTMAWHVDHATLPKYRTPAAWQAATRSALEAIGGRLRSAGRLVIPNFGSWETYPDVISSWLRYVDGGLDEWFVKTGTTGARDSYFGGRDWEEQLRVVKDVEAQDKAFLGIAHSANGDAVAACYGWATMLLAAQGRSSFALHQDYTNENWFPQYDYDLGVPLESESADATGVHRRRFANGLVLVNPTAGPVRVSFGGTYSGSGLSRATGAEMPSRTALILTHDGGPAAPGPVAAPAARSAACCRSRRRARVSRRVRVSCRRGRSCRVVVRVRHRGRTLVRRSLRVRRGHPRTITLRVPVRARVVRARVVTARSAKVSPRRMTVRR